MVAAREILQLQQSLYGLFDCQCCIKYTDFTVVENKNFPFFPLQLTQFYD